MSNSGEIAPTVEFLAGPLWSIAFCCAYSHIPCQARLSLQGCVTKTQDREAVIDRLVKSIRDERLRQKLSMNEVATRSGLNHSMIGRVERRERLPTIDTLLRIAEALEIDLAQFLARALKRKE